MKSFLAVVFRFLITCIVAELCLAVVWTTGGALDQGPESVPAVLVSVLLWAIPASITGAIFVSFFLVNRLFASRVAGYAVLLGVSIAASGGAGLLARMYGGSCTADLAVLPASYRPIAQWFLSAASAPWVDYSVALATFSALIAACWSLTRLSRARPLIGAFIAPSGALGVLYLFSVYLSGPADAVFRLAGIQLSRPMTTAALAAGTGLGLVLFDVLFAMKPTGAPRHG